MTRDELIARTSQLIDEGERLQAQPTMGALRLWLQLSDDLLAAAWGPMDRYHLAWLLVGKPAETVRGRPMTADEEETYVREVAAQKTAALRMSLDAVERQGMPFVGEDGGVGSSREASGGRGRPGAVGVEGDDDGEPGSTTGGLQGARVIATDPVLAERLAAARRQAAEHAGHERRAPRPEKMQR